MYWPFLQLINLIHNINQAFGSAKLWKFGYMYIYCQFLISNYVIDNFPLWHFDFNAFSGGFPYPKDPYPPVKMWRIRNPEHKTREKGNTTLRTYQYWIFHHIVIETCFEMIKSSEHERLWRYSSYKSQNILDCSKVFTWFPNLILLLNSKNRRPWPKTNPVIKECVVNIKNQKLLVLPGTFQCLHLVILNLENVYFSICFFRKRR